MGRATRVTLATVVVAATILMGLPAVAAARTKTVYAGPPPSARAIAGKLVSKSFGIKYSPDVNAFFLHTITINQGDTVAFRIEGFHNIDLPGKSGKDLPVFVPGAIATGLNDAAGSPFWFSGHVPGIGFNPAVVVPSGAHRYNGTARIESGLPAGSAPPFKVRFTKPGTYKFFCDIHPGMIGYVVVKPKGKSVPSAAQDAAALKAQITTDVLSAKKLAKTKVAPDHVSLGVANSKGVELFAMFPATLRVKAGTVVTFSMAKASRETHMATFGPVSYLTALANGFRSPPFSPAAVYPSSPVQPIALASTSHGNGFANTGALDSDPSTPLPASGKIKFTQAGTYHFICLIHPWMTGTIVVK
jgi:plastocyanin